MKRMLYLVLAMLLLCGCQDHSDAVQISIVESDSYTVRNNGQWVNPGEDAVFYLEMAPGLTVADTDYSGSHSVKLQDGILELTMEAVRYPARIRPVLTDRYAAVTYIPNGGVGTETTLAYDLTHHLRPNTATDLFDRPGYTLESWNTAPDGSGVRVGLGSRIAADSAGVKIYAQWAEWSDPSDFAYTAGESVTITGYHGTEDTIVIPAVIDGKAVTAIGYNAFRDCAATSLILPKTMKQVALGAFQNCGFESVTLFDTIENISDDSFRDCSNLKTISINAAEAPYGHRWRKESCYADKVDLLMAAKGRKKLVCYGGCAMWYNLDSQQMDAAFGGDYAVINLGLNGLVNSAVQMQIMAAFLEPGDVVFHTPELSSATQMMRDMDMDRDDDKLWCGLENNYDLVRLVEFGSVPGLLDSLCAYLEQKEVTCDYGDTYTDSLGRNYMDGWGSIPFQRTETMAMLSDQVFLEPAHIHGDAMDVLGQYYAGLTAKGVKVFVGYACVNLDAVPEEQRNNAAVMDELFREAVEAMDGPVLISRLEDYLYHTEDYYDTNYHLLSAAARRNTAFWIRDLKAAMEEEV